MQAHGAHESSVKHNDEKHDEEMAALQLEVEQLKQKHENLLADFEVWQCLVWQCMLGYWPVSNVRQVCRGIAKMAYTHVHTHVHTHV